jgi:CheY-like chemotaxis protein
MTLDRTTSGARLLLLLTSRDLQSAAQLARASGLSPAETLRQLDRLAGQGFVIAADGAAGSTAYGLRPQGTDDPVGSRQRILLLDDDAELREVVVAVLEDDGHAVIAAALPSDGSALLRGIRFNLAVTDGYSRLPSGVLVEAAEFLEAAGPTPVALFTAHPIELDAVRAAGFCALIEKPFDLDALQRQVRALLDGSS